MRHGDVGALMRDIAVMANVPIVSTNRRSRFTAAARSSHLRLAERDLAVLKALARYRHLSSALLHRLVGGSATTLKWRLRELFDAGLVSRPAAQWHLANAMHTPAIYELGPAGWKRLEELGYIADRRAMKRSEKGAHFWHTTLVCEFMASFEAEARLSDDTAFISEDEILARLAGTGEHLNPRALRVGSDFIIPDGLFGIRASKGVVLYALEVDRGGEPLTRRGPGSTYREKFELYRALIGKRQYQALLSTPAPLVVLHVTTTESRLQSMVRLAEDQPYHLFRAMPEIAALPAVKMPLPSLLGQPWRYPDGSPYVLA